MNAFMNRFSRSVELVERAVTEGVVPSAALAIGTRGKVYVREVFGNARTEGGTVPASLDTRYDLASMTKLVATTMIALRLIEEGRLCLSDTLGQFFQGTGDRSEITVRQLMLHSSGLSPWIPLSEVAASPEDAVRAILESQPVCQPGEQVHYSCLGFILLGKILEQTGGAPLDELARKYVFEPLSMTATGYCPKAGPFAATERMANQSVLEGIVHDENARFLGGIAGNAGVFSTLDDCVKFATMLSRSGEIDGGRFLSRAMFEVAVRNYTPGLLEHRGLGFQLPFPGSFFGDLFPASAIGHTGFTGTSFAVDPQSGLYVVLLTNRVHPSRENTRLFRVRRLLHNSVQAEFTR